jgi:hypothetical protein
MQIAKIVLYKDAQHVRVVPFKRGSVNIIVGDSKTGKSALTDIVDYCLASDECHIASGVIRDNIFWFAVVIDFGQDLYFFARQNPDTKEVSTISEMYFAKVDNSLIPAFDDIIPNTNIDSVKQFLAAKIGLPENVQIVDDGGTRKPLPVTFKHSRMLCFQPQSVIANKDILFYKTTDGFAKLALKDAIPYLIGAVREDVLIIEQKIKALKRELRQIVIKKNEKEELVNEQGTLAASLLEEAKSVGLINFSTVDSIKDKLSALSDVTEWEPSKVKASSTTNIDSEIQELVSLRLEYVDQLGDIQEKLSLAKRYGDEGALYTAELKVQHQRLRSIELLPEGNNKCCPLCHHEIGSDIPKVSEMYNSLGKIAAALEESKNQTLRNQKYISELVAEESKTKRLIMQTEDSIHALYQKKEDSRRLRDLNVQRGKVIGRISLFLEKLQLKDNDNWDQRIQELESEIKMLEAQINKSTKDDLMIAKIGIINTYMNRDWKKSLDLEDEDAIITFDPKRMQLYTISKDEKYVPLYQLGSGANWVGYHLLLHFALHMFFVKDNRPIPRFLFLDQPSQTYFVSDYSELAKSKDMEAVKRMFRFIIDRTNEMGGAFQVILTEHANINDADFQTHVVEEWYKGNKLIPEDWYTEQSNTLDE